MIASWQTLNDLKVATGKEPPDPTNASNVDLESMAWGAIVVIAIVLLLRRKK